MVDELAPLHHQLTEPGVLVVLVSEDVAADLTRRRQVAAVVSSARKRHSCRRGGGGQRGQRVGGWGDG